MTTRTPAPIQTVEAVSAGGVAFRLNGPDTEIAIIRTAEEGRWQLPKGIIDQGETAETAALREVLEEAGIRCELLFPIDTIEYFFIASYDGTKKRYHKRVYFYLMRYVSGDVRDHDDEVIEAVWVEPARAAEMLSFPNEKAIVARAMEMIPGSNG